MSTVTLSKPHCAITSAEKPDGIASQAFTATLPEAQISLILFATLFSFSFLKRRRRPLDAHLAHADLACGVHYCRPGIVRQGHAVLGALTSHFCFRIAGDQHLVRAGGRLGVLEIADVARNRAVEEVFGIDQ